MVDVCVVGAGMGGLATARLLAARNVSVVVLEARPQIGGRARSCTTGDGAFDMGATWFWDNEPRINQLLTDLGIAVFAQSLSGDAIYDTGATTQRLRGNPLDVPSGRFTNGVASLVDALVRCLPADAVRCNTIVTSINQADGLWLVGTQSKTAATAVLCRHVVMAIPPALAVASISFDPPLSREVNSLAASTPVWMGGTTKAVAVYADAFWRSSGLSGSGMSQVGPLRELHDMSGPEAIPAAIFGFAPSPHDAPLTEDLVVAQLTRMFGTDAATPSHVLMTDWAREPFTSPPNVRALTDYSTFGHRLYQTAMFDGTVHWGSTETGPAQPGHLEGALAAAERCVANIVEHMGTHEAKER
jgi:monoamine oxidase